MKRILLLSLLLLPIVALAQYPTFSNKQKLGVQTTGDGLIFRGNLEVPNYQPSNVNNAYFYLDTVRNTLKFYKDGWIQIYPTPQFDTTTLNVYLKISDTTAMLLPYFRDSDTTSLNLINRFALKLNISDTATMLTPYLRKTDTISLSNRINLKLNISDTTILSNRITTNANNIITINNKLATKLDTIYVKFKNVVTRLLNKDTINIGSSLTDGYAINIIGDSVNIDTVILDTRYPDRDSTNELQDITFATTAGIVTISGGKVMNLDTLYNSLIDSVNLLIRDSIAAFTPLTEGYGINIIGDSINIDTTVIFTQSDTITLSNRINLKLNTSDTITLSNRIDTKLNASDTASLSNRIDTKLDTIYVNYQTNVDVVTNKDTINIIPLTEGFGINIIGDSINIDSAVILETQQKQIAYVKNQSGVTIYKGQAVYSSGSSGSNKLVTLASSNTESSSSKTFGVVETDSIPNGSHGYVITFGLLSGINTNALTEGSSVYLSNTSGQLTTTKPQAPLHLVTIGVCIRQQQNNGSIFVKIQNGFEFDELHDVRLTTPVDKASIYYNLSEKLWRDTTATLLVSDTASMLNPYLRKLDTISLSNRIDLRVKYADTTNMLLPYFRTNDTTLLNLNSRLSIKLNLSDTANMLSKYVNTYSNQIDINGNKTFNNVVTIDSATVTGKLLVNTNISDAVKINSNTNSTNLELMNSGGSVFIKSGNKNMTLQTDTTALVYLKGDVNKVGILTMNPQQALEVNGTIRVDSLVNNLTPVKIIGANSSNDLTNLEIGNGLFISNDTLRVADNVINSGDTATLLRQDFLGINTNVLTWQQGSKKLLPYFTQVYRNGQLLKSESQYTITNDSIVTLATGSFKLDDNITIIAIDNIIALAGGGGIITLQGDVTGSGTNTITTTIGTGKVLNSMLAGSITNDKLDVITATNKVSNSATTATNLNTNNAIVSRDGSGNFSAGTITASLNGNANTATTLATGRTIAITGDLTYTSPSFNGSTNVTAVGTLANSGVTANTYTAATVTVDAKGRITSASANTIPTVNNGNLIMNVSGNGLTGSRIFTANQSTDSTFTVTSNATNINTPSTIVYRDASGNFSAGNITANTFIGNATSSTTSTSTVNVLNYLNSNELFKFRSTNATNVSGQILVTTPGTDFSIARNDAAQTFTGTQTFNSTIIGNISGNAATATNVAYSGLTGTVPTWNQNTTGNAATVTTNANLTGDVTSTGNSTTLSSIGTAGTYRSVTTDIKGRVITGTNPTTLSGYGITDAVPSNRTITINGTAQDLSANRTYNVGTVTSVSGTGTVSGLTLTGSVTGSGNLTLGGTLSLTSSNVTTALGYTPYNSTNPNGYITSSALSSYLPLTGGTLTGGLIGTTGRFGTIGGNTAWESGNFKIQPYNNYPSENFGIVFNSLSATETMDFYWFGYSEQPRRAFRFIDGSTDSEKMRIEPFTGNVGINQTVPSYKLDVNGTLNATGATTLGSTLNVTGITTVNNVLTINSGASNGLLLNGTNDQNIKIYSSNISGNAGIFYQNATTGQTQGIDGLFVGVIGQIGSYFINSENTKSYLYTNGNENQLVLDTDGNVGIGISDATNKLDINGTLRVRTTNTVAPTSILGRDNNGIVGGIIVGNGLTLSNSTLSLVSSGGFITTNSNYTVTITDTWIVFNNNFSNITVTLPDASTSTGRTLYFRNTAAGSIVSAGTANIINNTITTGTPNNNILGAGNTNVKWCTLVSNGQYWIKMQAGSL